MKRYRQYIPLFYGKDYHIHILFVHNNYPMKNRVLNFYMVRWSNFLFSDGEYNGIQNTPFKNR